MSRNGSKTVELFAVSSSSGDGRCLRRGMTESAQGLIYILYF